MKIVRQVGATCLYFFLVSVAAAQATPLQMDEAFRPSLVRVSPTEIAVSWQIEPGYYLYREYLSAKSGDGAPVSLETVPGVVKEDPGFGSTEVYYDTASATLKSTAKNIELTYQGCQDGGLCYPPTTKIINTSPLQFQDSNAGSAVTEAVEAVSSQNGWSGIMESGDRFQLAQNDAVTGVDSLLAVGGLPLMLLSFAGFGILLAFTPCVFPMYPIVAAMLTRDSQALSPRRGFMLSGAYALALASAFGLFGIFAAWSGKNLQFALQSTYVTVAVAGIFLVLALSNFGLFELQLPTFIQRRLPSTTSRNGSLRGAAILGFTSAFLIGPCVTAPLAGALLYIARTGDVAVGAAALFALGLGKAFPLIIMSTVGGKALPRAGAWMTSIRSAFGFGFVATAIWLVSPLLPAALVLLTWASLAVSFGIFLLQIQSDATNAGGKIIARSAAILFIAWGAMQLVGVGLGARNPLAPLEPLRSRDGGNGPLLDEVAKSDFSQIFSSDQLRAKLAEAKTNDQPTVVYITADWCVTCRGIERSVLPDTGVSAALNGTQLLTIDMTSTTPALRSLLSSLNAVGPPTMIFFGQDSHEVRGSRLVGDVNVNNLAMSASMAKSVGR